MSLFMRTFLDGKTQDSVLVEADTEDNGYSKFEFMLRQGDITFYLDVWFANDATREHKLEELHRTIKKADVIRDYLDAFVNRLVEEQTMVEHSNPDDDVPAYPVDEEGIE